VAFGLKTDCPYFANPDRPLVLSHRGACGTIPDHSAAAYSTAYFDGTDFDEPDLQLTKDGVLFVSHNPCLKDTTNIAELEEFKDRTTSFTFSKNDSTYECTDDWLINDFTWTELMDAGLKVRNRYKARNHFYDDMFPPMRLEDAIELMLDLNEKHPREGRQFKTGLYIETKAVKFYLEERGVNIAALIVDVLKKYDLDTVEKATKKLPIILESFEQESLHYFANVTDLPRIQLMSSRYNVYDMEWISQYAHGVGPEHKFMFQWKGEKFNLDQPSKFIQECHDLDLNVHPWILQDDILHYSSNSIDETTIWYNKGVDGLFTEFPENTLQVLEHLTGKKQQEKALKDLNKITS
jgi:glycerophosphoryl diester phosphodiesterase